MIGKISGKITAKGADHVLVEISTEDKESASPNAPIFPGIGYTIHVPVSVLEHHSEGSRISLWTRLIVKDDALELYGFRAQDELRFFEMLISVSGIGPRSALAILHLASVQDLTDAIAAEDTTYLTKVSGIGRKTAAKIVLELKEKIGARTGAEETRTMRQDDVDALEALVALGYTQRNARGALTELKQKDLSTSEKVKEALKLLSRA